MKNHLIIIDPGHGGADPGACAHGVEEKDLNLDIAEWLYSAVCGDVSSAYPAMTRVRDRGLSLSDRIDAADLLDADLLVSIHCNAAEDPRARGLEIWHHDSPSLAYSVSDHCSGVLSRVGMPDRGVKQGDFAVIRKVLCPAVLVECGFMTNNEDLECLKGLAYKMWLAEGIAAGIDEYLEGER